MRMREVKKYAGVWIIKLAPSDAEDMNWKEGSKVDIENFGKKSKKAKVK